MKVILIIEQTGLKDKTKFEKHLKREGLLPIEGEEFAYEGETTVHLNNTKAFILAATKKALVKGVEFDTCKIIFQVGDNPMVAYVFNKTEDNFSEIKGI